MYIDRIKKNIKDVAELISQLEGKKDKPGENNAKYAKGGNCLKTKDLSAVKGGERPRGSGFQSTFSFGNQRVLLPWKQPCEKDRPLNC